MKNTYTHEEIKQLVDGKLPRQDVHRMLSNFKDTDRFDKYLKVLQEKVSWKEKILLPLALHLFIVQQGAGERTVKCRCGHDFGDYRKNWKLKANINVRNTVESLREIYPHMMHCDPDWMEIREFFCPGCLTLLETEAVPPGYPVVFDFLPDLETFYTKWLGRKI